MPPHREKNINKEKENKRKESGENKITNLFPQEETWGLGHVDTLTAFIR